MLGWMLWFALNRDTSQPSLAHPSPGQHITKHDVVNSAPRPESEFFELTFEDELPNPVAEQPIHDTSAPHDKRHLLALIIDDVGYDMRALEQLLQLPFTITVSILPDAPYAEEAARMAHQHGAKVMLHMPMQTANLKYVDKMERFYLHDGMNKSQFTKVFEDALGKVPYAEGVNNHMGSKLTEHPPAMRWLMTLCEKHGLFFVDSRTSSHSVAAHIADDANIDWDSRDIFLDHSVAIEALKHAWASAHDCAARNDHCVILAHPHRETIYFLANQQENSHQYFSSFVSITQVLKH